VLEAQLEGTAPDQHGRIRLIAHPEVFTPRTAAEGSISVGSVMGLGQAEAVCAAELSAAPRWLSERLLFLGEIERRFDYEGQSPIGVRHTAEGDVPDLLPDDTALAYVAENGLVIITGCSHAGICNIIEQARRITGVERVLDVIGGFHLLEPPRRQLEETASYLGWLGLEALHACHCTDLASKLALAQKAPLRETGCGLVLQYD
jgi:7,8-dihydropterin-6-yl-methyl-4-(beta-D-ribofuranosyl)aminobenzene 5'-phosphate synthase